MEAVQRLMNEIIIDEPRLAEEGGYQRLSAQIRLAGGDQTMWFRIPAAIPVGTHADPFVIALLTTAMNLKADLRVFGGVSRRLVESLPTVQAIFHSWFPRMPVVPVQIDDVATSSPATANEVASFFSGGVDSFFTAIKNDSRVSTLLTVYGFDIPLNNLELRSRVSPCLQQAAHMLGKELIEIETNSRQLTEPHAAWPYHQFGAALASVAAVLGRRFGRVIIPASETYCHLAPRGSHPLVDPFWSTDEVAIEHDGAEATRDEKTQRVANNAAAMKYLRVCWRNPDNAYNCGKCEKCLRTMINLLLAGALERCATFPDQVNLGAVAAIEIPADTIYFYMEENIAALRADGRFPEIVDTLEEIASRYRADKLGREIAAIPQLPISSASLAAAMDKHRDEVLRILVKEGRWKTFISFLRACFDRTG
jgi:hypothetical protein